MHLACLHVQGRDGCDGLKFEHFYWVIGNLPPTMSIESCESVNPKPNNPQCHNAIILKTLGCNMTIVAKIMTTEHTINAFMRKQKDQTMCLLA